MLKDAMGKKKKKKKKKRRESHSLKLFLFGRTWMPQRRRRGGEWKEKSDKQLCPLGLADITDLKWDLFADSALPKSISSQDDWSPEVCSADKQRLWVHQWSTVHSLLWCNRMEDKRVTSRLIKTYNYLVKQCKRWLIATVFKKVMSWDSSWTRRWKTCDLSVFSFSCFSLASVLLKWRGGRISFRWN